MDTLMPAVGTLVFIVLYLGAIAVGLWITLRVVRALEQMGRALEDIAATLRKERL
jgi:hypothetical protein